MRVGFGVGAWDGEVVGVAVGVEDVEGHVGPGDLAALVLAMEPRIPRKVYQASIVQKERMMYLHSAIPPVIAVERGHWSHSHSQH